MTRPVTDGAPLVSVIVPAYNYGGVIAETLDSLLAQTYTRWECVVIDDESTDDTADVVARYAARDSRIRYVRQMNQGPSAARNRGIAEVGGEYVHFLDADDLIEPHKFEEQVSFLKHHPEVGIVYGGVGFFTTGRPDQRRPSLLWGRRGVKLMPSGEGAEMLKALVASNRFVVNAPLVRRSVVEAVGGFDTTIRGVEDWDYWLRCAAAGVRFQYQDRPGTLALVRSHSSSLSRDRRGMLEQEIRLREKAMRLITNEETANLNRELIARSEAILSVLEIIYGGHRSGLGRFRRALAADMRPAWKVLLSGCALLALVTPPRLFERLYATPLIGILVAKLQ